MNQPIGPFEPRGQVFRRAAPRRPNPYKPLVADAPPVRVEAVSLDWKWLFIYPDQGIATVNQLVFPAKTPLSLRLTSDSVMTAFFVPELGSQIYSMAGMQTQLNLMADAPGHYWGDNTQYSGNGFHDMHFEAKAVTPDEFQHWVAQVRRSPHRLDTEGFAQLEQPSKGWVPVKHFSDVVPGLFESIMGKFMSMAGMTPDQLDQMHAGNALPAPNPAPTPEPKDPQPETH